MHRNILIIYLFIYLFLFCLETKDLRHELWTETSTFHTIPETTSFHCRNRSIFNAIPFFCGIMWGPLWDHLQFWDHMRSNLGIICGRQSFTVS